MNNFGHGFNSHHLHITINNKKIRRVFHKKSFFKKREPQVRVNEHIWAQEARIIGENGQQLGVMSVLEATNLAKERGLDLVEVAPKAVPPVCKIADFGKFQYQKSKEERQNKSKQKKTDIKGIRISVRTDDHDLDFKKNQTEKFLQKGNKVKIEIGLKGREKAYGDLARTSLMEFVKNISVSYRIEQEIKRYPGGFNMIISPN